ncbi:ABC transporter substrate-binding protein [Marinospirillum sp.]|uniref:ABC transporter substrate-binding protein n=1 Tax=Marinospirillum sp. TaxID=2183934 RepID=UPI002870A0CC|nr:ABC transporter substrate-binding protein [Marinospirillum sp.]MDR9467233.1 ABC transporter substrate-binding protein [Marinospirillum sp.]
MHRIVFVAEKTLVVALLVLGLLFTPFGLARPLVIGLNADMSAKDAEAGEAIRRGALIALDEINAAGGVLGRPLELQVKDHRRNPARGQQNIQAFAEQENLVAVLGGKHTPVILSELPLVHELGLPYLIPWAAGTPIVDSGYEPNYVFRASVKDAHAGPYLVKQAIKMGFKRPALLLERTGWGLSNERALTGALVDQGQAPVAIEFYSWGEKHFDLLLAQLYQSSPDVIFFVGNAAEGARFIKTMQQQPDELQLPVISHWGVTGGDFVDALGSDLDNYPLFFLQTFSFARPPFPEAAEKLWQGYQKHFPEVKDPLEVPAPQGVAHAYDLVHLLALAIQEAGTAERGAVRKALLKLPDYQGVMRAYQPAFAPGRQDALDATNFILACYQKRLILPQEKCSAWQSD